MNARLTTAILGLCFCSFSMAGVSVIVHPSNSGAITEKQISKIFLGKSKKFPGGGSAKPVNQPNGSSAAKEFNKKALKKSGSQFKAYWSKLIFTGKANPPKEGGSDTDILSLVASNPNYIGYIDSSKADGSVKVVATY